MKRVILAALLGLVAPVSYADDQFLKNVFHGPGPKVVLGDASTPHQEAGWPALKCHGKSDCETVHTLRVLVNREFGGGDRVADTLLQQYLQAGHFISFIVSVGYDGRNVD